MYTISFDTPNRTLNISGEGFWPMPLTAAFAAELLTRATAARLRHGRFIVLADFRLARVQSSEVVRALEIIMPKALKMTSGPIATVAANMLHKIQIDRYVNAPNCRTFLEIEDAKKWLAASKVFDPAESWHN